MLLHADVVVVIPVHDEVAVLRARSPGDDAIEIRNQRIEVMERLEGCDAGPGLGRGSTHCVDDEPNGNVRLLLHTAGKVKRNRGDPASGVRRHHVPGAVDGVHRAVGRVLAHGEEADLWEVRCLCVLRSCLRLAQSKLHVGVAAAQPDVAHQDVVQRHRLLAGDRHRVGASGGRRIDLRLPAMICPRDGGRGVARDLHLHLVARI